MDELLVCALLMSNIFTSLLTIHLVEAVPFLLQPSDKTVTEGSQAMFACAVGMLTASQQVAWKQNNEIISRGDQIMRNVEPDQFSISVDRTIQQYTLVISSAKRTYDQFQYQCCILEGDNDEIGSSNVAKLTINQVPKMQFPICSTETDVFRSANIVTMSCTTELTDPRVNLEWWVAGRKKVGRQYTREESNQLILQYTFSVSPEDDGKFMRCSMYSNVLAIQRNCTIGPLNVHFQPNVTIQAPIVISAGREAVFICSSVSKPRATHYKWTFDRASAAEEYRIESSGFVLRIFKPEKFNKTSVRCLVSNSEGTGWAEVMIHVKDASKTSYISGRNLTRKIISPNTFQQSPSPDEMTIAMILAITGSCSFIIVLLMLIPLCMVRLFSQKITMDASGRIIAQPDVYFEPKDTILTNDPTLHDTVTWRRNVAIQVPIDLECGSESMYAEVETEIYTKNLSNGSIYVAKSTHV